MKSFILAAIATVAAAAPLNVTSAGLVARGFNCNSPVWGLSQADCVHMSNIGMAGMGENAGGNNGRVWVGNNGPSQFRFHAQAGVDVTLVFWDDTGLQYGGASYVSARAPAVSWTIPNGQSVTVSVADNRRGAWAGLYNRITTLDQAGQVYNVWGEYSTGAGGTLDVSREPNMHGNHMSIRTNNGCTSEWTTSNEMCSFKCTSTSQNGNWDNCGEANTYTLTDCRNQPGSHMGSYDGQPSGGCSLWSSADIYFYN